MEKNQGKEEKIDRIYVMRNNEWITTAMIEGKQKEKLEGVDQQLRL